MDTLEVLKTSRSCRKFKPDMVPDDLIEKVIEAGMYAPTGMGKQAPIIIAMTDKKVRDKMAEENANIMAANTDPFYGGPVVLVVLAKKDVPTHVYDGSLVMGNMLNAAHSLGLAGIWIHRAKELFESDYGKKILKDLGINDEYEGIGNCVIGYRDGEAPEAAPRKKDYVYYIK